MPGRIRTSGFGKSCPAAALIKQAITINGLDILLALPRGFLLFATVINGSADDAR